MKNWDFEDIFCFEPIGRFLLHKMNPNCLMVENLRQNENSNELK